MFNPAIAVLMNMIRLENERREREAKEIDEEFEDYQDDTE